MLLLAPMEGLLDAPLRDVLTRVGGIDRCVSEFIRVTDRLMPDRVFLRIVPELAQGGRTRAGVPVRPQLLGSDAACLADNAAALAALGAPGVDLNFGCPAKVVNRHGGGAILLDDPELIGRIVAAVRRAVPAEVPVSAKMRLGVRDSQRAVECALAIEAGGADEVVVHARTKVDGYRPPAWWERVAQVRAAVGLHVVANGEIWTADDALRCRAESGCESLMLGRGMVADPGLALMIRGAPALPWHTLAPLLERFWTLITPRVVPRHRAGRVKQWLNFLRRRYPQAEQLYQEIRLLNDPQAVQARLRYLPEMPSSLTSKCSVAPGGMTCPAPLSP